VKTITGRFRLDEDKARALIKRAIARADDGDDGQDDETVSFDADWEPRGMDEAETTDDLIYAAGECGAIEGPPGAKLAFQFMADSDGGMYQYRITWEGSWVGFVPPYATEYRKIADRDARGANAAMSILQEAVEEANRILDAAARG
jgi:hypothetical protein